MAHDRTERGAPGTISADALYTLAEIRKRLGLGAWAMRQARQRGLRVRRIGRRAYVLGRDLLDYLDRDQEDGRLGSQGGADA